MRLFLRSLLFTFFAITLTSVNVFSQSATITTDQPDYPPGSTVIISGTGFQAGETVTLQVLHDPTGGDDATDPSHLPWAVVADGSGNVSSTWTVPADADELGATLKLTAVGGSSGLTVSWVFTDAGGKFALGSNSITASNICAGSKNAKIHSFSLAASSNPNNLASVSFTTSGNYVVSDIVNFKLYITTNNTFSTNNLLGTISSPSQAGLQTFSSLTNFSIVNNTTYYLWITMDVSSMATDGHTISVGTTSSSNITTTSSQPTISGTGSASGTQTLEFSAITSQPGNQSVPYGANANFIVAASSAVSYQWQISTNSGSSWSALSNGGVYSNVTTATLNLTKPTVIMTGYQYRCVVTGNCSSITSDGTATLTVSKKDITGSFTTDNKSYDGNTSAAVISESPNGIIGTDAVTLAGGTATFDTKNVGTGKTVTLAGASLSGNDAGNYHLTSVGTTTANIKAIALTVSATADNKDYDGNTTAVAHLTTSALSGDVVTAAYTAANFSDKNVGTGKTVTVTGITISGADAGNYTLSNTSATTTANIKAIALTVSATADNKDYDGNTTAVAHLTTSALSGDVVTAAYTAANFSDKNVGTGKTVTVTGITISGADAGNYTLSNTSATTTANIKAIALTVSATADNKDYDGNTTAVAHLATSALSGDVVTAAYTAANFSDKNVGTGKTVTVTGITISGADAGNYTLSNTSATTTANIKARAVTITADAKSKTYGDADPALTYKITAGSLAFSDAFTGSLTRDAGENVGQYNITQGSVALNSNYTLSYVGDKLTINKLIVTVTADGKTKYCGQVDPALTYISSPAVGTVLVNGQIISFNGSLNRTPGETTGVPYPINLGSLVNSNYTINYIPANLTINGVSIDASATSNAIQLGTITKALTATVTSGTNLVTNASVTFTVTNNVNNVVNNVGGTPVIVTTNANGIATYTLATGSLPVGLYAVTAAVGTGCASTVAYFSVYDPNAGFVTGGGWINSPAGAYSADPKLTGKANFGFNAQYKKGNNTPDGNTEFQFQAGNLNFKSTYYGTGSLVIAGAKAIFQGTGTINGTGSYTFMISAIDGSVSGGGGVDKFRIKIWGSTGVVYDNNINNPDNADPATYLGGGSIVIHSTGNNKSRLMDTVKSSSNVSMVNNQSSMLSNDQEGTGKLSIKVMPNPTSYYFTFILKSLSKENIKLTVTDITGRIVEQRTDVSANSTLQLGSQYHPGIYIAEFMQGNDRITLRLIKEGK